MLSMRCQHRHRTTNAKPVIIALSPDRFFLCASNVSHFKWHKKERMNKVKKIKEFAWSATPSKAMLIKSLEKLLLMTMNYRRKSVTGFLSLNSLGDEEFIIGNTLMQSHRAIISLLLSVRLKFELCIFRFWHSSSTQYEWDRARKMCETAQTKLK